MTLFRLLLAYMMRFVSEHPVLKHTVGTIWNLPSNSAEKGWPRKMVMGYPSIPEEPKKASEYPQEELVPNTPPEIVKDDLVVVKKFGIPWKAIIGFLTVFFGQLLARVTVNDIPVLPETLNGWGSLIGGSLFAAFVIYFKGNVYTVPQAKKILSTAEKKAG